MKNKSNLENMIKKDLIQKSSEVKVPDEMFTKIIDQIEKDKGGNHNMLKNRISNVMLKRWVAISLCGVLAFGGMFTFSETARAVTLDAVNTIKTIFVLEKSEGEFNIVEKSTKDPIFTPAVSRTSKLSDEEISKKLGFNVSYPQMLSQEYKYFTKSEGLAIQKQVSEEEWGQIQDDLFEAINDEAVFNSLKDYKPQRHIFAVYKNEEGQMIFIHMDSQDFLESIENNSTVVKTKVGNKDATWAETMSPDYEHITENGVGKSDLFKKPERIVKMYSLKWKCDGVTYAITTMRGQELSMEEAVKIAESFMEQIK